jgi:hypothetical protein
MKVLLDIKDEKADYVMELLGNLPYTKTEAISSGKAKFLKELKGAVSEVKASETGKIQLKSLDKLINEL